MSGWGRFTLAMLWLFGALAVVLAFAGIAALFMGAWPVAIVLLILAVVLYLMMRSVKRTHEGIVGGSE